MQNQSSPAQLLFPTVPNNYCPEGKWSDIFNSFIQIYLNNGTINIPGLGLVTPQQITTINENIQTLQNQFNALALNTYSGSINVSAGSNQIFTISIGAVMPNTDYNIIINPISTDTSTARTNQFLWSLIPATITTSSFQLWVYNPAGAYVSGFNWTAQSITL